MLSCEIHVTVYEWPLLKLQSTAIFTTPGANTAASLWTGSRKLPAFLRDGYTFFKIDLLGGEYVLIASRNSQPAATLRKHIEKLRSKVTHQIIYATEAVSSDTRRRLIEQRIPFVVPGNQMYLPDLGIDLREHFRAARKEVTKFSPATQSAIILLLTRDNKDELSATALAEALGNSRMTASRTLNELNASEIGVVKVRGRERVLSFDGDRRELWESASPLLTSPVKLRRYLSDIDDVKNCVSAGISGLAEYSMLGPPSTPTVALSRTAWRRLRDLQVEQANPDGVEVEIWHYEPSLFAEGGNADRLSLYLSLRDHGDERVQLALDEMMGAIMW